MINRLVTDGNIRMVKTLTKQTIRVGAAGTGFIGPMHMEDLRRNGIAVLGLAELNKETAQHKVAELGIPCSFGSLDEMLADPDIDRFVTGGAGCRILCWRS